MTFKFPIFFCEELSCSGPASYTFIYKSSLSGLPIGKAKHWRKMGFFVNIFILVFLSGLPITDNLTNGDGLGEFPKKDDLKLWFRKTV